MKTIQVSTAVFAAVWAAHRAPDQTEDDILRRLLKLPAAAARQSTGGHKDLRYGVQFAEGFTISRDLKGETYEATVTKGAWRLQTDGESYETSNDLGRAIGAGTENLWTKWRFTGEDGDQRVIGSLRDSTKVKKRKVRGTSKPVLTLADLGLDQPSQVTVREIAEAGASGPNGSTACCRSI